MYVNLASATKLNRINRIITDIGADGLMRFYTGTVPASPDIAATDTLLATMSLSNVAGIASLAVQKAAILAAGTNGTNGTYNLTFSGGGGSGAAGFYTVAGNVLATMTISAVGANYTSAPTIGSFAVSGLTGASAVAVMTGLLIFNSIDTATAVANGLVGWARVTKSNGTGVIDLDVGTTNASVVVDQQFIIAGSTVTCSAEVIIEG